jgi:thiol-disulfide isomerase/thioredoxin
MMLSLAGPLAILLASSQVPDSRLEGRLNDRLVAEDDMARIELKPSDNRDLPDVGPDDRVFRVATPQFHPINARGGLSVAFVETRSGGWLYVDADVDGHLSASERMPYIPGDEYSSAPDAAVEIRLPARGDPVLPFRCRVVSEDWEGQKRHHLHFTASFRAEGYVDLGGRRTLVSLPFNSSLGVVNIRHGKIGIDADGDGGIDLRGVSGREFVFAKGEQVILRVGEDRYVSIDSANFAARSFVLKEHSAKEYTVIDVRMGSPLPDFSFTDFDGRPRTLSEFRGKYVLLDFWGSWCAPCVADLPHLKAAYDRFRDRRFEIVGIDYEYSATADAVRRLLDEKGVRWPNARPEGVKDLVEKRSRIGGFPTFILLDPDGVVIETRTSALGGAALIPTLERILPQR